MASLLLFVHFPTARPIVYHIAIPEQDVKSLPFQLHRYIWVPRHSLLATPPNEWLMLDYGSLDAVLEGLS